MTVSVVIPNFNGAQLLKENLPSVLAIGADEVMILDDASTDDSRAVLESFKERITTVYNEKNLGYGANVTNGFKKATGEIVLLLNTDVKPRPDVLQYLKPYFEHNEIFAVCCHEQGVGWARGWLKDGYLHHQAGPETLVAHKSLWASGGSAAFSRQKFLDLGGYDELYKPFYWEDTDISYRAWKRGMEIWWEPKALVEHARSSTIKKYFSQNYVDYIIQRNELLFLWKNITDKSFQSKNREAVIKRLLKGPGYIRPVIGALLKWQQIASRKKRDAEYLNRTDQEIFAQFENE